MDRKPALYQTDGAENRPAQARLLVSVRSAAEALSALEGGAGMIDVKEPSRGPLGRAAGDVCVQVLAAVLARPAPSSRVPVSAALGELVECGQAAAAGLVPGVSLYKLGLSRCGPAGRWERRLDGWRDRLADRAAALVAVAYADFERAEAPAPWDVLRYACERRLPFFLMDTFDKGSAPLRALFSGLELERMIAAAHDAGVGVALAGSLDREDLPALSALGPDVLAVRGAACKNGDRRLSVERERVEELVRRLS